MDDKTKQELEHQIAELENELRDSRAEVKPIVELFNAGKLLGKLLMLAGGISVGAATIWMAFGDFVTGIFKPHGH